MAKTSLQRHRPILPNSFPPCLLRPGYLYRSDIDIPHHSLLADRGWALPSIRLLLSSLSRSESSSLSRVYWGTVELEHLQGNAGWLYGGSQNRGSNEHLSGLEAHQLLESELERHPTAIISTAMRFRAGKMLTRSIQKPPLRSIMLKKSLYS